MTAYWLLKSEPSAYAWKDMEKDRSTSWSGVRNHQAAANMKKMSIGDLCFFYHSNIGKEIVGIVKVSKTYHPDPSDTQNVFGMVEVTAAKSLASPVCLSTLKQHPRLKNMALVRQSRLSVSPVSTQEWQDICALGGV